MSNRGKKWTEANYDELKMYIAAGKPVRYIAEQMGRTTGSISAKLEELNLMLASDLPLEKQTGLKTDLIGLADKYDLSMESLLQCIKCIGDAPEVVPNIQSLLPDELSAPDAKSLSVPTGPQTSSVPADAPSSSVPQIVPGASIAPGPEVPVSDRLPGLNAEQERAFDFFKQGKSICLTGAAGTGKSHIIRHITNYCQKEQMVCAVTGLTGVAASLIGGQTIHKFTGLGLIDKDVARSVRTITENTKVKERWLTTEVLIIDEVSMLNQELFEKLNIIAQKVRKCDNFYGGIQMIFCGDFSQLSPIKGGFCFESAVWQAELQDATVYLKQVQRQDNPEFIQILSEIRTGKVTAATKKILSSRIIRLDAIDENAIQPTMLYPHRKTGDAVNQDKLATLAKSHPLLCFKAKDVKYDFHSKSTIPVAKGDTDGLEERVPVKIELCVNCQVMLTVNLDVDIGLVNGSRGVIRRFEGGFPVVLFDTGVERLISPHVFEADISNARVYRSQVPLVLAWATTIHKCQGATLTQVITDLRDVFCNAQTYVTLSRVRSLEGLYLLGIDFAKIKCDPKVLKYYSCLENSTQYEDTKTLASDDEDREFVACVC
jgi:ATP-dependent DNA helicase PIF1